MVDKVLIKAFGTVQGVGFRYNVINFSNRHNITGYTKNLYDGSVEVVAEGEKVELSRLIDFIESSPGASQVTDIKANWNSEKSRNFHSFDVKY